MRIDLKIIGALMLYFILVVGCKKSDIDTTQDDQQITTNTNPGPTVNLFVSEIKVANYHIVLPDDTVTIYDTITYTFQYDNLKRIKKITTANQIGGIDYIHEFNYSQTSIELVRKVWPGGFGSFKGVSTFNLDSSGLVSSLKIQSDTFLYDNVRYFDFVYDSNGYVERAFEYYMPNNIDTTQALEVEFDLSGGMLTMKRFNLLNQSAPAGSASMTFVPLDSSKTNLRIEGHLFLDLREYGLINWPEPLLISVERSGNIENNYSYTLGQNGEILTRKVIQTGDGVDSHHEIMVVKHIQL